MQNIWRSVAGALLLAAFGTAAEADPEAAWNAYRSGNYREAAKALQSDAAAGNAQAALYLGNLYADGLAVPRDYRVAADWYRLAAEKNNPQAQFLLGFLYLNGAGEGAEAIAPNPAEAYRWLKAAAESGNLSAQPYLAQLLLEGRGVAADERQALRWARPAAARGIAGAQSIVGVILSRSADERERREGYAWLLLASRQNYPGAQQNLAAARAGLVDPEIAEATSAADSWTAGRGLAEANASQ